MFATSTISEPSKLWSRFDSRLPLKSFMNFTVGKNVLYNGVRLLPPTSDKSAESARRRSRRRKILRHRGSLWRATPSSRFLQSCVIAAVGFKTMQVCTPRNPNRTAAATTKFEPGQSCRDGLRVLRSIPSSPSLLPENMKRHAGVEIDEELMVNR